MSTGNPDVISRYKFTKSISGLIYSSNGIACHFIHPGGNLKGIL